MSRLFSVIAIALAVVLGAVVFSVPVDADGTGAPAPTSISASDAQVEQVVYSYMDYGGTNDAEVSWCKNLSRLKICNHVYGPNGTARWAMSKAAECDWQVGDICQTGNEQNAIQHCLWSGILTLDHGERTARGFLTRHEMYSDNPEDTEFDWKNNEIGISIANAMTSAESEEYGERGFIWGRCNHLAYINELEVQPG